MKWFDRGPDFENNAALVAPFEKWLAMDYYSIVQKRQFRTHLSCFVSGGCLRET